MSASDAPDAPGEPAPPSEDATLGGYLRVHSRPPAFEGPDGHPYTVSIEVERTADLRAPCHAYLVFPRWARTGVGIVGHAESPTLARGRTTDEATAALGRLTLAEVKRVLDEAIGANGSTNASA